VTSYLAVFVVAALVTFVTTPLVRRFVIRVGAIYKPNDRTVHKVPLPTMGGIAMYIGLVAALIASQLLPFFRQLNLVNNSAAVLVTCTLMLGIGVIDDTRGIQPLTKLVAQIFVGGVLVLLGVVLSYFWLPGFGLFVLSGDLPVAITILWVVAVANAVNLADGLDGLAAGMVAIAAAVFFIYSVLSPGPLGISSQPALLAAIICGVCIGFLPWNFHPAKIFMGDAGSMLLGMLLSITTIEGVHRTITTPSATPTGRDIALVAGTIAVPILVLLIPFLDVAYAIVRRTRRRQGIAYADKEHLHHHLMEIGHGHRQAVLLLYLWSLLLSGGALAVQQIRGRLPVGLVLVGGAALFLVTALPRLDRRRASSTHRDGSRNGEAAGSLGAASAAEAERDAGDAPPRNVPETP
jgi:UDP-GlcNAc:undecaprenyl-phosphate/decaprenyl-phosphate GlcNAc-1-phosphate transferase